MARIGEMRCLNPSCSCTDMAVSKTAGGNLSATCHKCGFPTFGKAGSKWRRDMDKLVRLDDAPAADAPTPSPPAPAPRKGFNLSAL